MTLGSLGLGRALRGLHCRPRSWRSWADACSTTPPHGLYLWSRTLAVPFSEKEKQAEREGQGPRASAHLRACGLHLPLQTGSKACVGLLQPFDPAPCAQVRHILAAMEEGRKVRPSMEENGSGSPFTRVPGEGRGAPAGGPFTVGADRRLSAEMPMKGSGLSDNMSLADTQRGSLRFLGTEVDQVRRPSSATNPKPLPCNSAPGCHSETAARASICAVAGGHPWSASWPPMWTWRDLRTFAQAAQNRARAAAVVEQRQGHV